MSIKFFGQYLIEKGAISRKQLLEAVEYQKNVNIKLGTLAIDRGLMDHEQVQTIIELQKRENKFFGELAIEKGYLTREHLDDLLNQQKSDRVYLGEALVEKGFLTLQELEANLKDYKKFQEQDHEVISEALKNIAGIKSLDMVISVTLNLFRRIVDISGKIGGCQKAHINQRYLAFAVRQRVKGDLNGFYILSFSQEVFFQIAMKMLKTHVDEADDITIDAVKEFVNIIIGHICTTLSTQGLNVEAEPPEFFDLEKSGKDAAEKGISGSLSVVPLVMPDETIELSFVNIE
jgi:CheY-specific phosphatase CheX